MNMNKLERTVIDQNARVQAAGTKGHEVLTDAKGEIMDLSACDLTNGIEEILSRTRRESTLKWRIRQTAGLVDGLLKDDEVKPQQGYIGGIIFAHQGAFIFGHSMSHGVISYDDPIQKAVDSLGVNEVYPAMMWVKALRAEAYRNRPDSMRALSISDYLIEHGLTLGSFLTHRADLVGATGFMPSESSLQRAMRYPAPIPSHIEDEPTAAFRLSGFCDQISIDQELRQVLPFAAVTMCNMIYKGGSLN